MENMNWLKSVRSQSLAGIGSSHLALVRSGEKKKIQFQLKCKWLLVLIENVYVGMDYLFYGFFLFCVILL